MLISEFARATELSVDTIRFYVRRGLVTPAITSKGGRNPYQVFSSEHVWTVQMIGLGQALGMSLAEIGPLLDDQRHGRISAERSVAIMTEQRDRLKGRASDMLAMAAYLDAKITWIEGGGRGPEPTLSTYRDMTKASPSRKMGRDENFARQQRAGRPT